MEITIIQKSNNHYLVIGRYGLISNNYYKTMITYNAMCVKDIQVQIDKLKKEYDQNKDKYSIE